MEYDFMIVGQGLAGSLLAYYLMEAGKSVVILNDESIPSSSRVAAGLYNPVTGKDLKKAFMADSIFPFLEKSYTSFEKKFNKKLLHQTNIYRPFISIEQQNYFLSQSEKYLLQNYLTDEIDNKKYNSVINNDLSGIEIISAGWLDISLLLDCLREFFIEKNAYLTEKYEPQYLQIGENTISYKNLNIGKIIFSEGFFGSENPLFAWLPFNPVKGEVLTANIEGYDIEEIVNQGIFILHHQNSKCKIGATYVWDKLDFETTETGKAFLIEKLEKLLKVPYTITDQQAGVRPATQDRRPFLGLHPKHRNIGIFNGLGTKGVSLAPYFSNHFAEFLVNDKELMPEINIERHYSLFL